MKRVSETVDNPSLFIAILRKRRISEYPIAKRFHTSLWTDNPDLFVLGFFSSSALTKTEIY